MAGKSKMKEKERKRLAEQMANNQVWKSIAAAIGILASDLISKKQEINKNVFKSYCIDELIKPISKKDINEARDIFNIIKKSVEN